MRRDGTGKCPVKWYIDELGKKRWVCYVHLAPYTKHREHSEKCWYSTCPGRSMGGYPLTPQELEDRKAEQARQKIKENEDIIHIEDPKKTTAICANYDCTAEVASGRKRYCSDKCRMQKARADYESRNPNRTRTRNKTLEEKKETPIIPPKPFLPEPSDLCSSTTCYNKVPSNRKAYCSDPCRKRAYLQRKKSVC